MDKPIVFLDVDGPLNPWAAKPSRRPEGYSTIYLDYADNYYDSKPDRIKNLTRVWLNKSHVDGFAALQNAGFEIIWATKWNHLANTVLNDRFYEIPRFPVAMVSKAPERGCRNDLWVSHNKGCTCTHSKTVTLLEYSDGRPFLWFDDEVTERDAAYLDTHAPQPTKVVWIDPKIGLTDEDFASAREWLQAL